MERGRDILLVAHDDIQIGRDHGRFKVGQCESFNHATIFRDFLAFLNQLRGTTVFR